MNKKYLLISHIPFMHQEGKIITDQLWANDLAELTSHIGPIRLAAPELSPKEAYRTWGPKTTAVDPALPIVFVGLPPMAHSWDLWTQWKIRRILKEEVKNADIVHSSNLFNPYLGLLYGHFLAARLGKKTVFVVAEDYHDTLWWEWVRLSTGSLQYLRRLLTLRHMDRLMRQAVTTASLTLLFTPAAVRRFRLYAANGFAVRDTTHLESDIVASAEFEEKCAAITNGAPLKLISASRHQPLKGVEFIIRAVAELKRRGLHVEADLFGHGADTSKLSTLAQQLDVSDRVRFPGALSPGKELFAAFAHHHISLMPHRTSEFARAFYDAMAGGAPVIAFATPASEGTVRDGVDGLLVPLDNAIALAIAIERLHRNRNLLVTLSRNARDRAFLETRTIWHRFRAGLIEEIFNEAPVS